MKEDLEVQERRRQQLALIESQAKLSGQQLVLLQQQIALFCAEESTERKGPQPAGPTGLALVQRAG